MVKSVLIRTNSKINVKKKIFNHLILQGKKAKCETFFLKTVKLTQKSCKKSTQSIIKSCIINSLSIINSKKLVKKKGKQKFTQEIPFVLSKNKRISLSIKRILSVLAESKPVAVSKLLQTECLLNSKIRIKKAKDNIEQELLIKKKYAKFRWFL
jgi:ribosomal protein S7